VMFGRRSHPRFGILPPVDGGVRVLRDVIVRRSSDNELVVFSRDAAIPGEMMHVEVDEPGVALSVSVEVMDSRPTVVDGAVRHQLRLRICDRTVR
jgi:hypothetical protein